VAGNGTPPAPSPHRLSILGAVLLLTAAVLSGPGAGARRPAVGPALLAAGQSESPSPGTPGQTARQGSARALLGQAYVYAGHFDFPPFEYLDEDGQPAGFNIDLVRAIAREAGVDVEFRLSPWREALRQVQGGRADLGSLALTDGRVARFDWLERTWTLQQVLVARSGRHPLPLALDGLAGEIVAVSDSSAPYDMLLSLPEVRRPVIVPTSSYREGLGLLARGEVDFVLGQEITLRREAEALGARGWEFLPIKAMSYHLVTAPGADKAMAWVSEGFREVRESGEYHRLVERHLTPVSPPLTWRDYREWLLGAGAVLVVLALAALAWHRSLSKQIAARQRAVERTRQLQEMTAMLAEAITPGAAADVVLRHGLVALGAAAGAVCRLDENGATLLVVGGAGYADQVLQRYERVPVEADVPIAMAVRTGSLVFLSSREEIVSRFPTLPLRAETQAQLTVPLGIGGHVLGAMGMSFDRPRVLGEEDRTFVMTLARQCALALERARLYDSERRARAEAEHANRAKDEFLATLSHELRTPLNAIVGWSHMLRSGMLPPDKAAHAIETIERNALAQTQLIEDLLDVSRATMGTLHVEMGPVEMGECLAAAIESVRPAADARRIPILLTPCAQPVWLTGDAPRLQQVFWNLLSNAIKFTPVGGQVIVSPQVRDGELLVSITDTGRGLDPAVAHRVFERFYQSEPSTMRTQGGLGLGLAIVRHLVELHGGAVTAESQGLDQGSTFTVTLPASPVSQSVGLSAGPVGA
jgi:signal transduction histidine kinase